MSDDNIVVLPLRKKDTSHPWGFKVDGGGAGKPLYICSVSPNGIAKKAGVRVGDAILCLGKCDVCGFTQSQLKAEMNRAGVEFLITLQRNAVDESAMRPDPGPTDTGVVAEPVLQFNEEGTPYQEVESVSSQTIADELVASEADRGPRPSSVFDRRRQDRSGYQTTTGVSYNRAYGRPMT